MSREDRAAAPSISAGLIFPSMATSRNWSAGPAANSTSTRSASTAGVCRATMSTTSPPSARSRPCPRRASTMRISSKASTTTRSTSGSGSRRPMSSSSTARPTISSSTARSAGRQQGQQSSLRRSGAADRGTRHSRQGYAVGPDHPVRRGVQRQCGAAGRRRPAASRQSRPGVPGQRSAMAHRPGALEL